MPEDVKPPEGDEVKPTPEDKPTDDKPKMFDEAYVKDLRKEAEDRRKALREAEKERDQLRDEKKKREEGELASQNKWEDVAKKAQEERDKALADLKKEQLNSLRTRIGVEFKLPVKLIERLQGATEDELRADAQALVEELGLNKPAESQTQQQKPAPTPNADKARSQTTVIAPGGQTGETDEERRARLYKRGAQNSPLFKPRE